MSKYLFLNDNLNSILSKINLKSSLFLFDFDGTLAPIHTGEKRFSTQIAQKTKEILIQLAKKVEIGILTGRGLEDVKNRLPTGLSFVMGENGIDSDLNIFPEELRINLHIASNKFIDFMSNCYKDIEMEFKKYSCTLHFLNNADRDIFIEHLNSIPWIQDNYAFLPGLRVINIYHKDAPHKGTTAEIFLQNKKYSHVFYFGDDIPDEDVFALKYSHLIGIKVGEPLLTKAQYYINDIHETAQFLEEIGLRI